MPGCCVEMFLKGRAMARRSGVMSGSQGRVWGFTLIELLVVVSIIALLVSILLPALSKAREQARVTICGSNQRSISLAMSTYMAEHGDRFPPAVLHLSEGYWQPAIPGAIYGHYCQTLLAEYVGTRDATWHEEGKEGFENEALLIFQCPSQPTSTYDMEHFKKWKISPLGPDPREMLRVCSSYAYNWNLGRGNLRPEMAVIPAVQIGNLETPSEAVMLDENWPGGEWFYPPNAGRGGDYPRTWPYCASWRHGGGTMMGVAMADGHVERRYSSDPDMEWSEDGPIADPKGRIWGPPGH